MAAIEEVQGDATTLRRAAQESTEDLLNDTVIKNWMLWVFDAMVGPDADPDVKRMAAGGEKRGHLAAPGRQTEWGGYREGPLASDIGSFSHGRAAQTLGAQDFIA
jgi:hypothetical protein